MKTHIKLLCASVLLTFTVACTDDFQSINTSPNSLTEVPYKTLITNAQISILNSYNPVINEVVSWARYNVRDVYVHNDRYQMTGSETNFNVYSGHLKNLQVATKLASEAEDNNAIAVAKILTSYAFQNLTDWYGDIPYSEALNADSSENATIYPKYDSQQSIYTDIIAQLKSANAMIDASKNIGSADVIFNGDMLQWKRFANSLLLRVYMRMSLKDPITAQNGIEEIMADSNTYPIIDSNENAAFKYWLADDAVYRSPYYMNPTQAAKQENVTSAFLIDFLKTRNDTDRLAVYAEPAASSGEYVGIPLGTLGQNTPDLSIMGVAEFRSLDSPTRIMRYSEVLFIIAEAALNGWNVGMTAQEAYEAAITASFNEYGLEPGSYLSEPLVDFNGGEDQRELIGDQKWCALYPDGNQGWAEVRRSGYPTYVATTEPVESLFPGKGIMVRKPYPHTEAVSNPDGFNGALEAQPGIIDEKFGAGVWWDVD
ncbi:SusD/RagB family nutrient-binding outer membrane lipoprotein [Cellulophaga sp. F20128]|uniref:SusD/RagB family nutrient-binding outer membrane lipoprotein n=1 Tax=Cellulophaga sp. F20128 TaxID=2926413 RepID=UPI001FF42A23|nr:SusD/RagB family nutrient-binding outer membrane lipoprotein [Cellulophaga sp. F20128]MCK0156491.1 SusD/RagB family nutrient-binding outer membrane lipoprotein [Cellulophaga sp. F20128]